MLKQVLRFPYNSISLPEPSTSFKTKELLLYSLPGYCYYHRRALQRLEMVDQSYGWTVEMQIKAIQQDLTMVEVPVDTLTHRPL